MKNALKSNLQSDEKRRLDRQTPYLSLLPEMDEGMHIGYQEKAGHPVRRQSEAAENGWKILPVF